MKNFNFDLQKFATLEATENGSVLVMSKGETYTHDGIVYTAQSEQAGINFDSSENIIGLASGIVQAVAEGSENSILTLDASGGTFDFSITANNSVMTLSKNLPFTLNNGSFTLAGNVLTAAKGSDLIIGGGRTYANGTTVFGHDYADSDIIYTITETTLTEQTEQETIIFTAANDTGSRTIKTVVSGTVINGTTDNRFTGGITLTQNSSMSLALGDYKVKATANSDATSNMLIDANGMNFYPVAGDGNLNISLSHKDKEIISGVFECTNGAVTLGFDNSVTLTKGTTFNFWWNNYFTAITANDDTTSTISLTDNGILLTPNTGDGTLKLTLSSANGSITADVAVLSGSFLLGNDGTFNVAKDTELQIKFSDDYIVNFKTTNDAGGAISLGENGITFTPNEGDGSLQLSVTKNGETRTASLDVNGSLTYKLDGSISLAEGTVVRNVFEDGNILTITANTDENGTIVFNPQNGLSVTPAAPDSLTLKFIVNNGEFLFDEITGGVSYKSGALTLHDGTTFNGVVTYDGNHVLSGFSIGTNGGETDIKFSDRKIAITPVDGASAKMENSATGHGWTISKGVITLDATKNPKAYTLTDGSEVVAYIPGLNFLFEKAGNYNLNGMSVTTTSDNVQVKLANYDRVIVDGISYTPLDGNVKLTLGENGATASGGKVALQMDGFDEIFGADLTNGGISYENGKFTVQSGSKTYTNQGNFPTDIVAQNDFSVQVTRRDDGLYSFTLPDGAADFAVVSNGVTAIETSLILNGEILSNPETHEIFLTKGTNFRLGKDERILQVTALDDAGGQLTMTESGIRFAPHENDGALEFNFLLPGRKATLDVKGAFTYGGLGRMSLEDDTEATFTWLDGNQLKLNSHGSTGSISLDFNKGIGITSADENLDMSFTSASSGYTTSVSAIQGTIWYNAGKVIIDENTKLTGSGSFGEQSVDVTLEAIGGDGFLQFGNSGVNYGAGTGNLKITLSRDGLASTFTVNKGEVLIGHNIFNIEVGSDISTDLQSFIPALYFKTTDPGEYTINGQTIKTTAENLELTATDNQMVFRTSSDAVEYDGMTFAGSGNVTLTPAAVALGNGVVATGFDADNTFILTEQGTVTADEKVFELTEPVPAGISVKGAENGFIFSRTLTKESEERLGYYDSPDIGKIFSEEFHSAGDNSYRIETDLIGLEKVSGISNGATITGGATLADEQTLSYYVLETDTNGKFTIGEKTYTLNDDNQVGTEIRARFDSGTAYADRINNLNGTVSGDFTGGEFKINNGPSMQVFGDDNVSIYANENGSEIYGLDDGASLKVLDAGTYVVNSTTLELSGTNFIVGNEDGSARILYESYLENGTAGNTITGTENDDVIYNKGSNVQINGLGGNDTITNAHADYVTIDGGDGNDTIITTGTNSTINAGAGDDYIILNSEETNNHALINYKPDEGNDTIIGFSANDTLKIDGEAYSVKSGNDLIVTVGDSRITLVDAANMSNPNIDADKNPLVELTEVILKRTEAGYPVMAKIAFSPDEVMVEPTNYADKEDWAITSSDNLKLHAVHYTPENSNDKWVMLIHGYGNNHTAMFPYLGSYLDNGYNVLMIDQRAAGESEGEWLTMGTAESSDVALWTQEIARRNSNAKITLHGVSMGAATAMLAAARPDAVNLTSIVEDCGYSNVMETFSLVNDAVLHQPTEVIAALDPIAASLTGYYLHDAAPINSISSVTVPSLFISGSEDAVAPVSMLSALYEASGAEVKEQYIVDGAPHALAIAYDPAGYNNTLFSFVAEADGEGVDIDNETDSIYLRGTSYNDTISTSGSNVTVDAGGGENIVTLSGSSETVIFSGNTTVEGFTPGFGNGADALYINQLPPGVEFFESGLTFLSSTDSVTFSDIHHTAKIDLYHTQNPQVTLASAVVLAEDEWYAVTDNDLAIRNDYKQGLYFVGGTTTANHGVDFSNIAQDVNVTIDTEYELDDHHLWINNVHSIKGGAGNTSITGSTDNDTIFAGGGQTSLWGGKGNDYLEGGTGGDTFIYKLGDGNDSIQNAGEGDLIFLSDVSMDQILNANINSESVALNFSDGGSINISGTGEIYQLANGSRYSVDRENLSWQKI